MSRAHVSVKVSLHAFRVIVSTVAAHKIFFSSYLLKFFRFVIFIVVIFLTDVVLFVELSCHSFYFYLGFTVCRDYFTHFEPSQT